LAVFLAINYLAENGICLSIGSTVTRELLVCAFIGVSAIYVISHEPVNSVNAQKVLINQSARIKTHIQKGFNNEGFRCIKI